MAATETTRRIVRRALRAPGRGGRVLRRRGLAVLVAALALAVAAGVMAPVQAWKPYTHTWSADRVLVDVEDGEVSIGGRSYPLDTRVARALQEWPRHYRAGVVGPDAFPDLVMGQSIVHPLGEGPPARRSTTGDWLQHVLDRAWDAQRDRRYGERQRLQILAFAYGYLTHAAGDLWAHTFVNEYAEGVFPALGDAATDTDKAAIILRHLVVEAYVGDATAGLDGNPDRQPVEGGFSDDSTPAVLFAAPPDLWIWETFVERPRSRGRYAGLRFAHRPANGQPTADRGELVDWFYDLHDRLVVSAVTPGGGMPWSRGKVRRRVAACVVGFCRPRRVIAQAQRRYALEWALDIEDGLQQWGRVGESFANGLFDPATRRAAQDDLCRNRGAEWTASRAACEQAVSSLDTLMWYLKDDQKYLTTKGPRLASMLGAPDRFLKIWDKFDRIMRWLDDRIGALVPDRLRDLVTRAKQWLRDKINDVLTGILGFDVRVYLDALGSPGTYLSNDYDRELTGPLSYFNDHDLFPPGTIDEVNELLGLGDVTLTPEGRLPDDAELRLDQYAPLRNTITTAQLTLLRGDQLDEVLSDLTGRPVRTYALGASSLGDRRRRNVMTHALDGGAWLLSIDSDHAWRRDGQPIWCTTLLPGSCEAATEAEPRPAELNGGTGRMPVWESCVLRPAFRTLFVDWQRKGAFEPFPDYGDLTSPDPGNDPARPRVSVTQVAGASADEWIGPGTEVRLDAVDAPAPRAFAPEDLHVFHALDDGPWRRAANGVTVAVTGESRRVTLAYQGGDPCWEQSDGKEIWVRQLDVDAPQQRCPVPVKWLSDDEQPLTWEVTEDGAGLARATADVADFRRSGTTATLEQGDTLAGYDLGPGYHAVTLSAVDRVGNTDVHLPCGVFVSATSASLRATLDQGVDRGDVTPAAYDVLAPLLDRAVAAAADGDLDEESAALTEAAEKARQMAGAELDADAAERLAAHAEVIATR